MLYKGQVSKVLEKNGTSKKGKPYTMYSLVLNTTAGEVMLGTAFDKPNVPPGAVVSIEAEEGRSGYLDADLSTLKVLKDESTPPASTKQVSDGVAAVDQRQRSIVTQNAYGTATRVIDSALAHGVLVLPKGKSATNHSLDVYLEVLDKTAQHVFNRCIAGLSPTTEEEQTESTEDEGEYDPLK